jgi:hypothetical protein
MIEKAHNLKSIIGDAPVYVVKDSEKEQCFCGEITLVFGPLRFPAAWDPDGKKHTLEMCGSVTA